MICSLATDNVKFTIFSLYLREIIKGELDYKDNVVAVINEAKDLTLGNKNYYNIDRYNYPIIVFLSSKVPDFFRTLDTTNIGNNEYSTLLKCIESQRPICVA